MKRLFSILPLLLMAGNLSAQLPSVVSGRLIRHDSFPSKYITARNVDVWLPEGYDAAKKYAVLYMHDGQMLFDANSTWNKQAWEVDDIVTKLRQENKVRDFIVVGVWNGGTTRHADYFPQKAFDLLTKEEKETVYAAARNNGVSVFGNYEIRSDNYLRFLVKELKPFIDRTYATRRGRNHTFIAGSSMGGLISLYAICEYPRVFGGAACLSTHWPGIFTMENNPVPEAFFRYMKKNLPNPNHHKIYFDYGNATLDALYPPLQQRADSVMEERGFRPLHWVTRFFPGQDHSEKAWQQRFDIPLLFLLGR